MHGVTDRIHRYFYRSTNIYLWHALYFLRSFTPQFILICLFFNYNSSILSLVLQIPMSVDKVSFSAAHSFQVTSDFSSREEGNFQGQVSIVVILKFRSKKHNNNKRKTELSFLTCNLCPWSCKHRYDQLLSSNFPLTDFGCRVGEIVKTFNFF